MLIVFILTILLVLIVYFIFEGWGSMKANAWLNHLLSLAIAGLFLLPPVLDVLCVLATGLPPPRGIEWIPPR